VNIYSNFFLYLSLLFTTPPSLLETNYVFYSELNYYVVYLLQASSSGSACFILAPHSWGFEINNHNRQTSGGIRTHNPSRRAAADLRLSPRGNWDRQYIL